MPRRALDDARSVLRLVILGAAVLSLGTVAQAQRLSVVSARVGQPGDIGRVCVVLSGGQGIAGIQNDLVWDGNCATLADESSCAAVGSHGKQVHFKLQQQDFRIRALALSLSDTRPMGDGPVYCCNMQSEAAPGSCCSISIVGASASDPGGSAVGLGANSGQICTQGDARSTGNINRPGQQSLGASNADSMAAPPAPQAPPAAAGAAPAAAPPPVQVLPGGGGGVKPGTAEAAAAGAAPGGAPVAPAGTPVRLSAAPTAAVLATPNAAVTSAAIDTPTRAVDTPAPTVAVPASSPTIAVPTLTPTKARGWLGCQIAPGASPWPLLGLAAAAVAWLAARRRRAADR